MLSKNCTVRPGFLMHTMLYKLTGGTATGSDVKLHITPSAKSDDFSFWIFFTHFAKFPVHCEVREENMDICFSAAVSVQTAGPDEHREIHFKTTMVSQSWHLNLRLR
ncbi:hypothetical protein FQA47_020438 [Oryzias melastigma]|uniref:Uncharacterized protein n=1 Tax=Oryzias melastigma TaxID=30732 RepID=A0A834FL35_ORYME|nr:hypothetical protein FQA47_020438 [Oryzias melastigma]